MTDEKKANPWGLTPREVAVLSALAEETCNKAIARRLCISTKTVECLTKLARAKMQTDPEKKVSRVQAAVHWDRFVRSQGALL